MAADIHEKLEAARKDLLDLGLRNSLINYAGRAKRVDVVDELSRETYRLLVTEGKTFAPIPDKLTQEDNNDLVELFAE